MTLHQQLQLGRPVKHTQVTARNNVLVSTENMNEEVCKKWFSYQTAGIPLTSRNKSLSP